jgi:hypothetical protein
VGVRAHDVHHPRQEACPVPVVMTFGAVVLVPVGAVVVTTVGAVVLVALIMTVGADVLVAAGVVTVWSAHFTHGTIMRQIMRFSTSTRVRMCKVVAITS